MGKITGIGHVAITAKDMDKSLDFYTRILGFRKAFEIPNPKDGKPWINYLYIGKAQFVELFYNGTKPNPWSDELAGVQHICLEVDDIAAVVEHVKKEGGVITDGPKQGADYNWQAWLNDPDGVRVELMQIDKKSPHYAALQKFGA